jgi:hypothetical protein
MLRKKVSKPLSDYAVQDRVTSGGSLILVLKLEVTFISTFNQSNSRVNILV